MLWVGIIILLKIALGFLIWPWFRRSRERHQRKAHDLAVYRAQLDEVNQDLARGSLSQTEADAARLEIQRRLLRADATADTANAAPGLTPPVLFATAILLGLLPIGAIGLYLTLGHPEAASPRATQISQQQRAQIAQQQAQDAEMEQLAERLRKRLESEPNRPDGWLLLGRTMMNLGRFGDAVDAFRRLTELTPDDPEAYAYLGEAYVFGNDGRVTQQAAAAFRRTLQLEPGHPSAQYYIAMGKLEAGDARGAFADWLALARMAPPDAPWLGLVYTRLQELAPRLNIDLNSLMPPPAALRPQLPELGATPQPPPAQTTQTGQTAPTSQTTDAPRGPTREQMEAAQTMSAEDRAEMIRGMVESLAQRLEQQPNDLEGWLRLARAREVLRQPKEAADAYAKALALMPPNAPMRGDIEAKLQQLRR
ncbi:c-type cytochrome biogenesis protein CcmI [Ferrovibrio sp.]|uniref:c-type cytochrome biogenesis protein CcmI n=1 Tax=Ferrovibrio sp. TaxID=1917215 RepID=UPI0025B9E297|nr:c-type cytochrome biogenesis protein CcmI [Ferrovibrio sp.]MBX3455996.1 c-type cytochrome biogenesis protein CcmI [Ferrovibrio sp.]